MKIFVLLSLVLALLVGGTVGFYFYNPSSELVNPLSLVVHEPSPTPRPLLEYTFENLKNTASASSQIRLGEIVKEDEESIEQLFYFDVPKTPRDAPTQQVSGLANIPKATGNYPIIVMFRGFVPDNIFASGVGTQPAANVFAKNGFITLAPDFLGFGESASSSADGFESRFQTYTTALTLLNSLPTLESAIVASYSAVRANDEKVGLWGHSNGGHIALSTLAISGKEYPTVLWAPVSKPFPYSILYYTDEYDDGGKDLRKYLAGFEGLYDVDAFSPPNYYEWIKAPLQIHQGTADEEVLPFWTDELIETLKKNRTKVEYYKYSGADHNLRPDGWGSAVERSLNFYSTQFK